MAKKNSERNVFNTALKRPRKQKKIIEIFLLISRKNVLLLCARPLRNLTLLAHTSERGRPVRPRAIEPSRGRRQVLKFVQKKIY